MSLFIAGTPFFPPLKTRSSLCISEWSHMAWKTASRSIVKPSVVNSADTTPSKHALGRVAGHAGRDFADQGKKRLVPAGAVNGVDHENKPVMVSMTKDEVKSAPGRSSAGG
jgi:hypothetical protein